MITLQFFLQKLSIDISSHVAGYGMTQSQTVLSKLKNKANSSRKALQRQVSGTMHASMFVFLCAHSPEQHVYVLTRLHVGADEEKLPFLPQCLCIHYNFLTYIKM